MALLPPDSPPPELPRSTLRPVTPLFPPSPAPSAESPSPAPSIESPSPVPTPQDASRSLLREHLSDKTLTRLILLKRMLKAKGPSESPFIYSHELARLVHTSPASIRRDLMCIGVTGSASRGYDVAELLFQIEKILETPLNQPVALVGVGNLGRAILAYLPGRLQRLSIVAAFDSHPAKVGTLISGCPIFGLKDLAQKVWEHHIAIAIVAVPAESAQQVTDRLVEAGVRGIINFAPIALRVPASVFVEHLDMTLGLEKVACFTAGLK